jgi:hypothetical protein
MDDGKPRLHESWVVAKLFLPPLRDCVAIPFMVREAHTNGLLDREFKYLPVRPVLVEGAPSELRQSPTGES